MSCREGLCASCCPWSFDACCCGFWMKEKLGLTLQQRTEINLSLCYIYAHTNTRSRCTGSCCERWELICTCACYFTRPQTSVFVICTRDCSDLYLVIHSIDFYNILLTMQPRLRMKGHHSKEVRCARHFKCRTALHVKIYIHCLHFITTVLSQVPPVFICN